MGEKVPNFSTDPQLAEAGANFPPGRSVANEWIRLNGSKVVNRKCPEIIKTPKVVAPLVGGYLEKTRQTFTDAVNDPLIIVCPPNN
jgi:hypothetical protein